MCEREKEHEVEEVRGELKNKKMGTAGFEHNSLKEYQSNYQALDKVKIKIKD